MAQSSKKIILQSPTVNFLACVKGWYASWQIVAICIGLAAMTFAVFAPVLHYEFINFDDDEYVYDNPVVAGGLTFKGFIWAFTHFYADNWHPLTWLSHMLDCQLYGMAAGGHHLTNVLFHTATVISLFLVLRRMTGAVWRSAFVAAFFAVHPLRVESVAWVAERKDVLSGLFFVLTIGAYIRYARSSCSPIRYGLVLLLFVMGLMCKPMLVSLPAVLCLLDFWPLQRKESMRRLVLEKLPLLALSAAACVVTIMAQREVVQSTDAISLPLRFANALATGIIYLRQMVWPVGLAVFYPFPRHSLPMWEVASAGMLIAGISIMAWRQRRERPWILTGWLWYLVMLLPVIGIIQVGVQAHADRYTYLPQIGIYVTLTWLIAEWGVRWHAGQVVFPGLGAVTLAVLMIYARKQTDYWKNSERLWTHALACTADNETAEYNLSDDLLRKGDVPEAIAHLQSALKIKPDDARANINLGNALQLSGRMDDAISSYQSALRVRPDSAMAHSDLGSVFLKKGLVDEAITECQEAVRLKPDLAIAHYNLGDALYLRGKMDEAATEYEDALKTKPDYAAADYGLGNILMAKGKVDEAIPHFEKALKSKPDFGRAHNNLGNALSRNGKVKDAIFHYEQAQKLEPSDAAIQNNLAWLLATTPDASLRNGDEAVKLAQQANTLMRGKNATVLRTLAASLAEAGQFNDAKRAVREAIELAQAAGQTDMGTRLNGDLQRYEAGLPLHP